MNPCPFCNEDVNIHWDVLLNEVFYCELCDSELEIIEIEPVTLALAPPAEEDWGE